MRKALSEKTPYETLAPETVMEAVESLGYQCTGHLLPLNSYENRVYDVGVEGDALTPHIVAKFYRPHRWSRDQITEEHDFAHELAEAEVDVVPPLVFEGQTLFEYAGYLFCLYPKRGGRSIELISDEDFRQMGRLIARIHNVGAQRKFSHRIALTVQSYGWDNLVYLRKSGHIPGDLGTAYDMTVTQLLTKLDEIWGEQQFTLRTHGDCHLGNILKTTDVFFVDLDDSLSAPAIQDLWMFVSGDKTEISRQFGLLLEGYTSIRDFDFGELKLVEVLRSLRMIHYTAWLARRWEDPTFPKNFPFFKTNDYWQKHLLSLKEQISLLEEPILVAI